MKVNEQDRKAFSYHAFVHSESRFIFFTIPKVACTSWIQLFLRLEGYKDWANDPHHRAGRPFLSDLSCESIECHFNDTSWTKAVFFRDPAERLLSAYLDKIVNGSYITRRQFNAGAGEISFRQFVEIVTNENTAAGDPRGLHENTDPHWKPQHLISNIEKFLPCTNFVGDFANLQKDSLALLERVGIWNEFGASGWGSSEDGQMFEKNIAVNKTGAAARLKDFYTDEMLVSVKKAYAKDYDLLAGCELN